MSRLEQLKASAGSGKTFALTERFLALMGESSDETPMACAPVHGSTYSWPEILAATFTNKAASEMKQRVVEAIKRAALEIEGSGQQANWPPKKAEATLDRLLRRYHQLNIRTIDSLLNLLLKIFALDAGLTPDFEIIFDPAQPFGVAMDRLISACETGDQETVTRFDRALTTLLNHERDSKGNPVAGFWLVQRLRERLQELVQHRMVHKSDVVTDPEQLAAMLVPSFEAFKQATTSLNQCLEGLDPLANFTKFLAKCAPLELFDGPPDSAYATKESLEECVKKASKGLVTPAAEVCWRDFRACYEGYKHDHAVLNRAYALAPVVELAGVILDYMAEDERKSGQVLGSTLPGRVRELLNGEYGVPDAFCRLGGRLHHLLIDEFQDTSRDQWAAITPLAEECLSKGGSLFYVGDVKQAIYGWRGGDATLFEEIGSQDGLAGIAQEIIAKNLEFNWRSREALVTFNNDLFSRLAKPNQALALAGDVLGGAPQPLLDSFGYDVSRVFADAAQDIHTTKDATGGYLRLELLTGGSVSETAEQTLDRFEALVVDELAARRPFSDICVLVRKAEHASWLCDRLVNRGVPVITESSLQLKRHPVPRQLAALLAVADYPGNDLALAQVLLGDLFLAASNLDEKQLYQWMAEREPGPLHLSFKEAYPEAWEQWLAPFTRKAGLMTPYDLASDAARFFRVLERHPEAELFLKRFLEMIHRAGESGMASLSAFMEFWETKGDEEKVSLPESVNAVRIMTMHKAKGLQFPVVVVPFLNWPLPDKGDFITVDLNGASVLTTLSKNMGTPFWEKRAREALEQLNLLYVAFTRAEEELYGYLPNEAKKSGPALKALKELVSLDHKHPIFEAGTVPEPTHSSSLKPEPTQQAELTTDFGKPEFMAWLPRLRVYRHMEEAGYDARMRGEAAHRAMEHLRITGQDKEDALRARTLAVNDFPVLVALDASDQAALAADMDAMLAWALGHPELRDWLGCGKSEISFLDADGQPKRPDFIAQNATENVILEFKTGQPSPDHARQVRAYLPLVRAAFPDKPARGVVVYLDLQTLEKVEE